MAASLNSLTLESENAITRSHNASGGEADFAAHPGVPIAGGSGDQRPGIRYTATSHQITVPDHILDNPGEFDDAPYVPPRIAQAEPQIYPALDPRLGNVYDPPNHDIQHVRVFFVLFLSSTRS